jgi:hypothetical protein
MPQRLSTSNNRSLAAPCGLCCAAGTSSSPTPFAVGLPEPLAPQVTVSRRKLSRGTVLGAKFSGDGLASPHLTHHNESTGRETPLEADGSYCAAACSRPQQRAPRGNWFKTCFALLLRSRTAAKAFRTLRRRNRRSPGHGPRGVRVRTNARSGMAILKQDYWRRCEFLFI